MQPVNLANRDDEQQACVSPVEFTDESLGCLGNGLYLRLVLSQLAVFHALTVAKPLILIDGQHQGLIGTEPFLKRGILIFNPLRAQFAPPNPFASNPPLLSALAFLPDGPILSRLSERLAAIKQREHAARESLARFTSHIRREWTTLPKNRGPITAEN